MYFSDGTKKKTKNLSMKERTIQCSSLLQFLAGVVSITVAIKFFLW